MIHPDHNGNITCPMCRTSYKPELTRKDDRLIQLQFPKASREAREELISGFCRKCQEVIFAPPVPLKRASVSDFIKETRPDGFGKMYFNDELICEFEEVVCDLCNIELIKRPDGKDDIVYFDDCEAICSDCFSRRNKLSSVRPPTPRGIFLCL